MLLAKLRAYRERLDDLPPPGYAVAWVRYEVHLESDGTLLNPEPVDLAEGTQKRGQRRHVPQVVRTNGIKPLLLSDNAEYTLQFTTQPRKGRRVAASHDAYMQLLQKCAAATQVPEVEAVLRFLQSNPLSQLHLPEDYDAGGIVAFRVAGQLVTDIPLIQHFWWIREMSSGHQEETTHLLKCLICGENRPALKTLPGNIKGIPGGQSSGMALISANADAFESYGLLRAETSPVCVDCADTFTKVANSLINDQRTSLRFGSLRFVYWAQEPTNLNLDLWLRAPNEASVTELLHAYRKGGASEPHDGINVCAVSLSANAARVVVRDWLETTVGNVKTGLALWFLRQRIVGSFGEVSKPVGLYTLAVATVRDQNKDLPATTPCILLRSALSGSPLPDNLLYQAIRRNLAEQDITRPRAALIKAILLSQQGVEHQEDLIQLQPDYPEMGYQCGRLLALLQHAQRSALSNHNTSIVNRFYGAASTAPALVMGRLLRAAQPYLAKLHSHAPAAATALQNTLSDILDNLTAFPRLLNLKDQAYFALGYYHQRAHDRAQAQSSAKRRRDAQKAAPTVGSKIDAAR